MENIKVYTMHVEKPLNVIKQHPFHLGTDFPLARELVLERLRADWDVRSIALRLDGKLIQVFDERDR